jgi:hypothetical protein
MTPELRLLLILSLIVSLLAFAVPWLTHFADAGFSVAIILIWCGLLIASIVRHGRRGLFVLAGAPLALFWPVALIIVIMRGDLYLGF